MLQIFKNNCLVVGMWSWPLTHRNSVVNDKIVRIFIPDLTQYKNRWKKRMLDTKMKFRRWDQWLKVKIHSFRIISFIDWNIKSFKYFACHQRFRRRKQKLTIKPMWIADRRSHILQNSVEEVINFSFSKCEKFSWYFFEF